MKDRDEAAIRRAMARGGVLLGDPRPLPQGGLILNPFAEAESPPEEPPHEAGGAGASLVAPPRRVEAERFEREMAGGRNKPLVVAANDDQGPPVSCVIKLMKRVQPPPPWAYTAEWLAAVIGERMGVVVPTPFEVVLTPDFADAVPDLRRELLASCGSVYGSELVTGTAPWVTGCILNDELRPAAARLLAFDIFIHNPDRRRENPNFFTRREQVIAFDHGDAFSFVFHNLGGPPPEVDPLPQTKKIHALAGVFGRKLPDLEEVRASVQNMSDQFFHDLEQATPLPWRTGDAGDKLKLSLGVLKKRRDAVDQWWPMVKECMA